MKNMRFSGSAALFLATVIWSTSFVVLKKTLDDVSVLWTLAMRFLIAAVVIAILLWKEIKRLDKSHLINGSIMGTMLFVAYVFQTYGLAQTTPGKNAFLTAIYCVIVPFLYWLIAHKRPDIFNIIAAFMCLLGVGLTSLTDNLSISAGDGLTLIGGCFYAIHIVATAHGTKGHNVIILTFIQLTVAGILSLISAAIFEPFPTSFPAGSTAAIIYLSVMCTAATFFLQTFGQKHTPPSQAAIILTMESVLGTMLSAILGQEDLSFKSVSGFALIFFAIVISETNLDFLKKKTHK